jgi:hypothetical protein
MRRLVRYLPWLAAALLAAPGAVAASERSATDPSPTAHAATMFKVNACKNSYKGAEEYLTFLRSWRKAYTDRLELTLEVGEAAEALAKADADSDNVAAMVADALPALDHIKNARNVLIRIYQDYNAMARAVIAGAFSNNRSVEIAVGHWVGAPVTAALDEVSQALDMLQAVYNQNVAGHRATDLFNEGTQTYGLAQAHLVIVDSSISRALQRLSGPCKDFGTSVAPMSAAQINDISGGGGTQRQSSRKLSVLAPKRLALSGQRRTALPLTLTTPAPGTLAIWLTRGQKAIVDLNAFMGRGATGLRLNLPRGTTAGTSRLTITYVAAAPLTTTATLKLTIRLR